MTEVELSQSPGRDVIDGALEPPRADLAPRHFGTAIPHALGGNDPPQGISAYARARSPPHRDFVICGLSD